MTHLLILAGLLVLGLVSSVVLSSAAPFLILVLVGWLVDFLHSFQTKARIVPALLRGERPAESTSTFGLGLLGELDRTTITAGGNTIVHSGFSPFAGFGTPVQLGSFAVDLTKRADDETPVDRLDVSDLRESIVHGVRELMLPQVSVSDYVFVNGKEADRVPGLVDHPLDRPCDVVSGDLVENLRRTPHRSVRTYLALQGDEWDGEVIPNILIATNVTDTGLHVEMVYTVLYPLKQQFREAERYALGLSGRQTLMEMAASVRNLVALIGRLGSRASWRRTIRRRKRHLNRQKSLGTPIDHGVTQSVRDLATAETSERYFQDADVDRFFLVVERRAVDSIIQCLKERGISTSDFEEGTTNVINKGTIISGSTITGGTIAGGAGSKAKSVGSSSEPSTSRIKRTARSK